MRFSELMAWQTEWRDARRRNKGYPSAGSTFSPSPPVNKLIAGTNVALSPATGLGDVTINSSGGSGPLPATTVTGPDAYASPAVVGTSTNYARQDHDHGLPAAGGGGTPSPTVQPEVVGGAGVPGVSTDFQPGDHVHAMPAANESNYVANDNTGNLAAIINADTSATTISAAKAPGSGGTPATTVTGPDAFGASAVVGTSTNFAREDHDHGLPAGGLAGTTVTGPDVFGASAVVGTSTNFAREDHDHGLVTAPDLATLPWSAGVSGDYAQWNGTQLVAAASTNAFIALHATKVQYNFWFDGTTYHMRNLNTGADDYSGTVGPTVLAATLNASTDALNIGVIVDGSINLTGQTLVTIGSSWAIWSPFGTTLANASIAPCIGQLTIAPNTSAKLRNISIAGVTLTEEDLTNTSVPSTGSGSCITDIDHFNVTFLATGGAGKAGLVIDISGSYSNIQYVHFYGDTAFAALANDSSAGGTYPGGAVTIKGGSTGSNHLHFDHIKGYASAGTAGASLSIFNVGNPVFWGRVFVGHIDMNFGGAQADGYLLNIEGGTGAATLKDWYFGPVEFENHLTASPPGTLVNFTAAVTGTLMANFTFKKVYLDTGDLALFDIPSGFGTVKYGGPFASVEEVWTNSLVCSVGTLNEIANAPVYVGRAGGNGTTVDTGHILSTPVSGTILSVGGSAAWAAGTTYTCGGTPLTAVVTGTVTLTSSDNTAMLTAAAVTNAIIPLVTGMTLLVAAGGTAVFSKAV